MRLLAVAFGTGAAVMVVELMAVRLMAPWFGASQLVWTHVIGVVLAALAAGQWLGGLWAERGRGPGLPALLAVAGALVAAMPELVAWLGAGILPDALQLEEAYPFVTWGSLLVALLVMGLPLLLLGAVSPFLVRMTRGVEAAPGLTAGRVMAAGTLGALAGTFAAGYLLLAWLGSAGAVRLAGGVLVLCAWLVRAGRVPRAALLAWLAPLGLLVAGGPDAGRGATVLEARETPYQTVRVEEVEGGVRLLRVNEALDSYHSAWRPDGVLTGYYFDAFVLPALLAPPDASGVVRTLVIGLAGGTMARQIVAFAPDQVVEGVEIDPDVVALGRRWFDLPESVRVHAGVDGRTVVAHGTRRWSAILVDAYAHQIYLPAHLCTREFFAQARERLLPGGVVALNLGGRSREDPVVAAVAGTCATAFEHVEMAWVPASRNMIVLAWAGAPASPARRREVLAQAGLLEALGWLAEPERFAPVAPSAEPLRDGDAPVEALAHRAWRSHS